MSTESARNASAREVLANSNFRKLWLGHTVSQIGDGLTSFAVLILIHKLTGSTGAVATMAIALALPQLLFGLVAGVFVDRWDRKRIMIVSDLVRGALVLAFILVRRPSDVWLFYLLGFTQSAIGTFFEPAKNAFLPSVVEPEGLLAANALSQTTRFIARKVGAAFAGVLVGVASSGAPAFLLDALTFFVSALFVARIAARRHEPRVASGGVRATLGQLSEGLRLVITEPVLSAVMLVMAGTSLALGVVTVLSVPFLVDILGVRTETLGTVRAAEVVGAIVASAFITGWVTRFRPTQLIVGSVCVVGALIAAIGAAPSLFWVLVGSFGSGVCVVPLEASVMTLMQTRVLADERGRASSALSTVMTVAYVLSMGASGLLGEMLGIRQVFYLAGGVTIAAGLVAARLMSVPAGHPAVAAAPSSAAGTTPPKTRRTS